MRMIDHDTRQECRVIPFVKPAADATETTTSTIAAVIAVTILHETGQSPEDRLLEIIEQSGEVEVIDIIDAMDDFGPCDPAVAAPLPANDNRFLTSL
jgi:hypothetical protein